MWWVCLILQFSPSNLLFCEELSEYQLAQQAHTRVVADFQQQMQSVSEMMEPWCFVFLACVLDHMLVRYWIHGCAMKYVAAGPVTGAGSGKYE